MRAFVPVLIGAVVLGLPRASAAGEADEVASTASTTSDPVVHVRFPAGSYLPYIDQQSEGGWHFVCKAPCDRRLASGGVYRVRGRTGYAPESFLLPSAPHARVDAYVGSRSAGIFGPAFVVAGLAVFGGGTAALFWPTGGGAGQDEGRVVLGVTGIVTGLIVAGVGALIWHFGSSDVTVTPAQDAQ